MKKTTTTNKTEQNYQLITINRYDIADSEVHVVPQEFMKKWLKFIKNETEASIASLRGGYKGLDSEEMSWLWVKTDKKVDAESQEFIDQHLEDFEEFSNQAE
jgi:hypothetical protein